MGKEKSRRATAHQGRSVSPTQGGVSHLQCPGGGLLRGWPSSTAWGLESCSPLAVRGKGKSWESGTAPVWGELPSSRAWEVALLRCGWEVALLRWAGKLPSSSRWWEVALLLPVVGSCPPLRRWRWWEVADSGHRTRSTVRRLIPNASPCAVAASGIEVLQPLKCCNL